MGYIMFHYFTSYSKKCAECKSNLFILLDGYTICSQCGLILESHTAESDFVPAGYFRFKKRKSKQKKKKDFEKYYLQKYGKNKK